MNYRCTGTHGQAHRHADRPGNRKRSGFEHNLVSKNILHVVFINSLARDVFRAWNETKNELMNMYECISFLSRYPRKATRKYRTKYSMNSVRHDISKFWSGYWRTNKRINQNLHTTHSERWALRSSLGSNRCFFCLDFGDWLSACDLHGGP
jgi:hypothetical protein